MAALFAVVISLVLGAGSNSAYAGDAVKPKPTKTTTAPKPPAPKAAIIKITGDQVTDPILIKQADQPKLYSAVFNEVNWLGSAKASSATPDPKKLGPKYTVVISTKDNKALLTVTLYPLASGGPRAWRAKSGSTPEAWMYGMLTMSETLRIAGVPLKAKTDVVAGGVGGGIGTDISVGSNDPDDSVDGYFGQIKRLFLLNGAVIITVLFGLAGVAFLIRRRV